MTSEYSRLPRHIGIIPDGNRRWAALNDLSKEKGYAYGVEKGKDLFDLLHRLKINEVTVYAFTKDNTKRKKRITDAYVDAVVSFLDWAKGKDISILAVGDHKSKMFPAEFEPFIEPEPLRDEMMKMNFLVNYDWRWDMAEGADNYRRQYSGRPYDPYQYMPSRHISRIDLLIRWGGMNRISGFPPVQTVYSDIYVVDEFWPDFEPVHVFDALEWYQTVDVTLGG
jgi:undecaprenyl diphosphate synthase